MRFQPRERDLLASGGADRLIARCDRCLKLVTHPCDLGGLDRHPVHDVRARCFSQGALLIEETLGAGGLNPLYVQLRDLIGGLLRVDVGQADLGSLSLADGSPQLLGGDARGQCSAAQLVRGLGVSAVGAALDRG